MTDDGFSKYNQELVKAQQDGIAKRGNEYRDIYRDQINNIPPPSENDISIAWNNLVKDNKYKNYLLFKNYSDSQLKNMNKKMFETRENVKKILSSFIYYLRANNAHTVNLATKDSPEDQKIWYIPDKQFEILINEIKINNPGSLQEDVIKRHRQERSDFKHGVGSKKSSISNVYKTYKPWGGKTRKLRKTKSRKSRKCRRTKSKKMKRRKTRK
jgi:hypothetical protein